MRVLLVLIMLMVTADAFAGGPRIFMAAAKRAAAITYPVALANNDTRSVSGGTLVAMVADTAAGSPFVAEQTAAGVYSLETFQSYWDDEGGADVEIHQGIAALKGQSAQPSTYATKTDFLDLIGDYAQYNPVFVLDAEPTTTSPGIGNRKIQIAIQHVPAGNMTAIIVYFDPSGVAHYWNGSSWTTSFSTPSFGSGITACRMIVQKTATDYVLAIKSRDEATTYFSATIAISSVRATGTDWFVAGDYAGVDAGGYSTSWKMSPVQVQ